MFLSQTDLLCLFGDFFMISSLVVLVWLFVEFVTPNTYQLHSLWTTSCLTTAFPKYSTSTCTTLSYVFLMHETVGQRKLRLTKQRLVDELSQRTAKRVAQLKELESRRATEEETKATQCIDKAPCLTACLFCFWLLVVNLLFLQWLHVKGRLKLD